MSQNIQSRGDAKKVCPMNGPGRDKVVAVTATDSSVAEARERHGKQRNLAASKRRVEVV
jgi:hypothetical protein